MKTLILLLFFGLFALLADATPIYDTSPTCISVGMPDGTVPAIVLNDMQKVEVTPLAIVAYDVSTDLAGIVPVNRYQHFDGQSSSIRLCPTMDTGKPIQFVSSVNNPPTLYGDVATETKTPRVKEISLFGVHRACTIRLCRSQNTRQV